MVRALCTLITFWFGQQIKFIVTMPCRRTALKLKVNDNYVDTNHSAGSVFLKVADKDDTDSDKKS